MDDARGSKLLVGCLGRLKGNILTGVLREKVYWGDCFEW